MRKWMRDKLKRRKKSEEAAPGQPAPLQPAYFDAGQSAESGADSEERAQEEAPASVVDFDSPAEPESSGEGFEGEEAPAEASAGEAGADARKPRRRRRGGRGRRRSGPKPAAQPAEVAAPVAAAAEAPAKSEVAPELVAAARPRASKGTVVLAIGLPGSGKSSWFKRHNLNPLSSDMIRAMLFDDPTEQRFQDLVFSNLRSMLRARLVARRPVNYVDATNLTPHDRHSWIKLAKDFGYEVQAVYFDVPLEVCLERNARRQRVVEDDIMRKMAAKLKAPTFEEGFSKITVVRVKAKE
jgi:predicted kinase